MKSVHPVFVVVSPSGLNFKEISQSPESGVWVHVGFVFQGFQGLRAEFSTSVYDFSFAFFTLFDGVFDFKAGSEGSEIGGES